MQLLSFSVKIPKTKTNRGLTSPPTARIWREQNKECLKLEETEFNHQILRNFYVFPLGCQFSPSNHLFFSFRAISRWSPAEGRSTVSYNKKPNLLNPLQDWMPTEKKSPIPKQTDRIHQYVLPSLIQKCVSAKHSINSCKPLRECCCFPLNCSTSTTTKELLIIKEGYINKYPPQILTSVGSTYQNNQNIFFIG